MDLPERDKVCTLIEAVITADGVVDDAEREFFRRIVERFGLPPRELTSVPSSDYGRTTAMLRGLSPDVRSRVLALLVEAAVIDGRVDPAERALLLSAAASLGVEAVALEERIAGRLKSLAM